MRGLRFARPVGIGIAVLAVVWVGSLAWDRARPLDADEVRPLNPPVQVRLQKWWMAERVPLGITGEFIVSAADDGRELLSGSSFDGALEVDVRGVRLAPWIVEVDDFRIEAQGDAGLRIGDRWYRGRLHVRKLAREGDRKRDGLELRLELPLEDYVLGVVCGEMPTTASGASEGLKAQAVAARTYALHRLRDAGRDYLRDDPTDQRFHGVDFETDAARRAVEATRGTILFWDGEILPAYYHAECGGATGDSEQLDFTRSPLPPLRGASDPGCRRSVPWQHRVPPETLDALAAEEGLGEWIRRIEAASVTPNGRWLEAKVVGERRSKTLRGADLVRTFGTPSNLWAAVTGQPDGSLLIEGFGRGHGVGFCQTGALRRSREQQPFAEILGHYYPGAELRPLADLSRVTP